MTNILSHLRFRLRALLLLVFAIAVSLSIWLKWEYIPGTYYRDANGFPHGTGTDSYMYGSGQIMLQEWYRGGLLYRATWFRPDGTNVATEEYNKLSGGVGYYLRPDGSIKSEHKYQYSPADHAYLAYGEATYYNADGTIEKVVQYVDGSKLAE